MSGELVRYRSYGVARQHRADLDAVERGRELASQRIAATADLTRQAVREVMLTALCVEEVARLVPSAVPEAQLIASLGAQGMAAQIARFQ